MPATRRLEGADFLRAVATLAVITTHAVHWPQQTAGVDHQFWLGADRFTRFCVPAFVVLSGVVLAFRHGQEPLGEGFARRRVRRSVLPWLTWAPVYLAINLAFNSQVGHDPRGVASWFAMGGGHLYFLLIIPQLYLLYMVWPRRTGWALPLAAGALAAQIAVCAWRLYGPVPPGTISLLALTAGFELFPFWIGYFALGLWIGTRCAVRAPDDGRVAVAALAAVPLAAALLLPATAGSPRPDAADGTGAYLLPVMPPLVICVCLAALYGGPGLMRRSFRLRRAVEVVSRYSLGIYIVHPMLMRIPGWLLHADLADATIPRTILPALTLIPSALLLSLVAVRWLAATPLGVTVGMPRPAAPAAHPASHA